jgi:peptide deformylase
VAIQPIRLFGDPVLRTTAVEVVDFDRELRRAFREPAQLAADPSLGS